MPQVVHINESQFRESMLRLRKMGGAHQRAYDEACRIISSLQLGEVEKNKLTNHGESRIPHCVKFNISNDAHRLVTVQTDNFIYLLYVGTHDDTDRWLDRNRGLIISCNPDTKKVTVTHVTKDEPRTPPLVNYARLTEDNQPYFKRIDFDPGSLVAKRLDVRVLNQVDDNTSDEELDELFDSLNEADSDVASLMMDVIFEIREGKLDGAKARIEQFYQQAVPIQDDADLEAQAVEDIVNSDNLAVLTGLSEEQLKELFSPEKFQEWMLFLHPDQKRIAEADYDQSVILTGVSGSGKTCVLVHRARYLAKKYPGERIGVLTLNRSLCRLISNLVDVLCTTAERESIVVMAFYDYFALLVRKFGPREELKELTNLAKGHKHQFQIQQTIEQVDPNTFAREYDPRSGETLEDTWELFLEQPVVRTELAYFREHLRSHDDWVDPERYLREEFSLLRSAVPTSNRVDGYLELNRSGRSIPLPERTRRRVLDMLLLYEETMLSGGILDELGLTLTLLQHRTALRDLPKDERFRCLLIDEFQDFSTRDLALLRLIPTEQENGFFLAGDTVQRVLVKDLRLGAVGLDITSARWERMRKNYRNSRQILRTAALLANKYSSSAKGLGEEVEFLDPELAVRETSQPKAIACQKGLEVQTAWQFAQEALSVTAAAPWSICIVTACPERLPAELILKTKPADFPVKADRVNGDYTRSADTLVVGTMSDVKGFEFSQVIVVGCSDELLPLKGCAKEEEWRDALRLYVAMTRARDEVRLLYSGKPSKFLEDMSEKLDWESAC